MLPGLSHLQYLVLENLAKTDEFVPAKNLLQRLAKLGHGNRSLPAFYMFMDRLVEAAYVEKKAETGEESRRTEALYKIVDAGRQAMKASKKFYCRKGC